MLRPGQPAPDFSLAASDGQTLKLSEQRGQWVVLFFFPKAFTPGCTIETRAFAKASDDLEKEHAVVFGISTDPVERQCAFADATGAKIRLLSDPAGEVARSYGALWTLLGVARRVTYVIDPQGSIAFGYASELRPASHIAKVRDFLRGASASAGGRAAPAGLGG